MQPTDREAPKAPPKMRTDGRRAGTYRAGEPVAPPEPDTGTDPAPCKHKET